MCVCDTQVVSSINMMEEEAKQQKRGKSSSRRAVDGVKEWFFFRFPFHWLFLKHVLWMVSRDRWRALQRNYFCAKKTSEIFEPSSSDDVTSHRHSSNVICWLRNSFRKVLFNIFFFSHETFTDSWIQPNIFLLIFNYCQPFNPFFPLPFDKLPSKAKSK